MTRKEEKRLKAEYKRRLNEVNDACSSGAHTRHLTIRQIVI